MNFEIYDSFYVEEADLEEMVRLVREEGYKIPVAVNAVACGWNDCEFYTFGLVQEQVYEEIKKRLDN